MLDNLKEYRIVLASGSPRRSELLKMAHINFEVLVVSDLPEAYPVDLDVNRIPEYLARQKQAAYASEWGRSNTLVLTADNREESAEQCIDIRERVRKTEIVAAHTHREMYQHEAEGL